MQGFGLAHICAQFIDVAQSRRLGLNEKARRPEECSRPTIFRRETQWSIGSREAHAGNSPLSPPLSPGKTGNCCTLEKKAIRIAPKRFPPQTGMQMIIPKSPKDSMADRRDVQEAQPFRRRSFGLTESTGSDIDSHPSSAAGSTYSAVSKTCPHALHSLRARESTLPTVRAIPENEHVQNMEVDTTRSATGSH